MHTQSVRKIGNSEGVIIPKAFLEALGLHLGQKVTLEIMGSELIVRAAQPRYSLEDLVSQMTNENEHPEITLGSSVGEEQVEYLESKLEGKKAE